MTNSDSNVRVNFHTQLGDADNAQVNVWELQAAHRALRNIKSSLGQEALKALIQPEMDESDHRIHELVQASNGEFKDVFVQVDLHGLTATEYVTWQANQMRKAITGTKEERADVLQDVIFPSHPEHYLLLQSGIVETLGGLPTNATVIPSADGKEVPDFVHDATDPNYPHKSFSNVSLADGTIWGCGVTEYRDTDDGGSFRLHVWWPKAAPQIFFDDHNRHFAVEYRNFVRLAATGLGKDLATVSVDFHTQLGDADEAKVDEWELLASRRALANIKELLGQERLQALIAPEMIENEKRIKKYLEASHGEFKEVFVQVDLHGMSATDYVQWQAKQMRKAITGTPAERDQVLADVVFPAHPEHYLLLKSGIVETLGGLPTNAAVFPSATGADLPDFVHTAVSPDYPHKSFSNVKFADGTTWGCGVTEYRDTEDGGNFRLHVWWPKAAPQIFFDDHNRHFAVEYRNFVNLANK
ncbi:hypothetical protein [Lacticaseibacillus sharpeae]|uniref:Uncharacterized protein n=1 Tax=Lacticaseibacillus sharpeae JCM 1186 = DSM 20505 TaxID=1291052 RepID=A0A0R1ZTP3_9LACO|nr:hypothetical protein [Lacticaseibacillus sharpeae]KRM55126.1 hypothetical protein FC18_GL001573 [Lacticaseibacillus sharpeae JCM 1186 = DSM 20505]